MMQTIPITWLFSVWGLDLVGPLKRTTRGFTHLLVTIDKFSKWIEARPITNVKSEQAALFFTDIIHRFGVPNCIITDNGTQFTGKRFLEFCDDHHIRALVGRGSPKEKCPSGTCQWHPLTRPKAENLQQIEQTWQEMGR
jgi:transposase InsO family protein